MYIRPTGQAASRVVLAFLNLSLSLSPGPGLHHAGCPVHPPPLSSCPHFAAQAWGCLYRPAPLSARPYSTASSSLPKPRCSPVLLLALFQACSDIISPDSYSPTSWPERQVCLGSLSSWWRPKEAGDTAGTMGQIQGDPINLPFSSPREPTSSEEGLLQTASNNTGLHIFNVSTGFGQSGEGLRRPPSPREVYIICHES